MNKKTQYLLRKEHKQVRQESTPDFLQAEHPKKKQKVEGKMTPAFGAFNEQEELSDSDENEKSVLKGSPKQIVILKCVSEFKKKKELNMLKDVAT